MTRAKTRLGCTFIVVVTVTTELSSGQRAPASPAAIHVGIEMRNLALHVAEGVVLGVRTLDGEFVSHSRTDPPVFDDPQSYTLRVGAAEEIGRASCRERV